MLLRPFRWIDDTVTGYTVAGAIHSVTITDVPTRVRLYDWVRVENNTLSNVHPPLVLESPERWLYMYQRQDTIELLVIEYNDDDPLRITFPIKDDTQESLNRLRDQYGITRQIRISDYSVEDVTDIDMDAVLRRFSSGTPHNVTSVDELVTLSEVYDIVALVEDLANTCNVSIEDALNLDDLTLLESMLSVTNLVPLALPLISQEKDSENDVIRCDIRPLILHSLMVEEPELVIKCAILPSRMCMMLLFSDYVSDACRKEFMDSLDDLRAVVTIVELNTEALYVKEADYTIEGPVIEKDFLQTKLKSISRPSLNRR